MLHSAYSRCIIAFPFYPICVANTVTEDVKNKYCENEGVFYFLCHICNLLIEC